jgi:hypothetical protein
MMPVFLHHCDDTASFKMIVSQFFINCNAKQAELVRVFGIQPLALKRWVNTIATIAGPIITTKWRCPRNPIAQRACVLQPRVGRME